MPTKMTSEELTDHQYECLRMANEYYFLLLFHPSNEMLKEGLRLCLKFADQAKFRAIQIDMGRPDPAFSGMRKNEKEKK